MKWTPEKLETVGEMVRLGQDWKSIGNSIGCSAGAASRAFSRIGLGVRDDERALRPIVRVVSFKVDPHTWESLNESALARGKCVGEMVSDVASIMTDTVLLENVLDDGFCV